MRPPAARRIWRDPSASRATAPEPGAPSRSGGRVAGRTDLVWRDPAGAEANGGAMIDSPAARPPAGTARPAAPDSPPAAAPAVAPAPALDLGRLVDEVMRRIERIGRDERLRRGL